MRVPASGRRSSSSTRAASRRTATSVVDRREDDRIRPLPAFLDDRRLLAREHARIRAHLARFARAAIELREEAAAVRVRAGVEDVGIARIGRDVAVLRAAGAVDRRRAAASAAAAATAEPPSRVLLGTHSSFASCCEPQT